MIESVGEYVTEGYITAHGRDNETETSGFVFENCTITGTLKTYLGRPWRPFARVLFYGCFMENIIDPLGWHGLYSGANEYVLLRLLLLNFHPYIYVLIYELGVQFTLNIYSYVCCIL